MQVATIGLDLAKHVFQIHGIDAAEKVVVRKQLRRSQVMGFFEALPPTRRRHRCSILGAGASRRASCGPMRPTSGPWAGRAPPGVIYVYAPDRKHARPAEHLAGFSGILQVDGYGAYAELAQRGDVALAFCWSHVRRQFYEIQVKTPAPIATEALVRIAALYAIEADIRGLAADERRQARQRRTKPLVDDLRLWLEAQLAAVSGKSTIAGAIRYALSRWEGLTRFLDDGRIEIDSNVVERSIRPIALGRKNHLFAGSDGGGEQWAVIASLVETCKMNAVDPQAYLHDVLSKIVARHPMGRIDELLPFAYVPAAEKAAA
jgi:transposase